LQIDTNICIEKNVWFVAEMLPPLLPDILQVLYSEQLSHSSVMAETEFEFQVTKLSGSGSKTEK
jgi:hypothetical protein